MLLFANITFYKNYNSNIRSNNSVSVLFVYISIIREFLFIFIDFFFQIELLKHVNFNNLCERVNKCLISTFWKSKLDSDQKRIGLSFFRIDIHGTLLEKF
jgi:hypothetical protein